MSIQSVVEGQITSANTWASEAHAQALTALQALSDVDIPNIIIGPIPFTPLTMITPDVATQPELDALDESPEISEIADITKPDRPDFDTVELGDLLTIVLPEVPSIEIPSLSFEAPVYSITAPKEWGFSINDILITDDPLMQAAINRLKDNIENGGTGLDAEIEDDIWNRDLERNEQALEDALDKAKTTWAKNGFSLPDGLLAHSLSELHKEYMNKSLDRSREIAIKQAELEQSNLFKSLELAVGLAGKLIDLLIRYEELVLKSQEDIAKFANEYIDLQIKTYMALVEAYKAQASVYESTVRAALAKVEVYKAEIEGQKLVGDVNKQTVEVYVEQLRATTIIMERYKTEIQAMTAELDAERMKIEGNKLQFDAWAKKADVSIAQYAGKVELFKAVSQQNISTADLENKFGESSLRASLAATELSVKSIEVTNRSLQNAAQIRVEAAKGVAAAAASLAAGAMAGVTTGADMRYQESWSGDLD